MWRTHGRTWLRGSRAGVEVVLDFAIEERAIF